MNEQNKVFYEDLESYNIFKNIPVTIYRNKRIGGYNTETFEIQLHSPINGIGDNTVSYDFNTLDIPDNITDIFIFQPKGLNQTNSIIFYTVGSKAVNYNPSVYDYTDRSYIINNRRYLRFKSSEFREFEKVIASFKINEVSILFKENYEKKFIDEESYIDVPEIINRLVYTRNNIDNIADVTMFKSITVYNAEPDALYIICNMFNNHTTAHTRQINIRRYYIHAKKYTTICKFSEYNENNVTPAFIEKINLESNDGQEHFEIEVDWSRSNNEYMFNYLIKTQFYIYKNDNYKCIMPKTMICIVNNEYNIYYNNILRYANITDLINASSTNSKIIMYKKFAKYIPTETVDDFNVHFLLYKQCNSVSYCTDDIMIKTIPKNSGAGLNKKILIIGDSLTDADHTSKELKNLFENDDMCVDFLGTRQNNSNQEYNNINEGYSGWRAYTFVCCQNQNEEDGGSASFRQMSVINPFYNPEKSENTDNANGLPPMKFDFSYYMNNQNYSGVDYVFICLGTNDFARGNHNSESEIKRYFDYMIDSIKSYNPDVKIGLWLPPTRALADNAFKSGIDGSLVANKWIIENYDNREDENIFLIPAQFVVDPENDYNITYTPVNPRTPNVTIKTVADTVHPKQSGYLKIADLMYGYIKYFGYLDSQE